MPKKMPFRFRKSVPFIGRFLQGTVSKKGLSLNLRLGPLAKSWGTGRRRSTTLDMPGTSGIFWRSQTKASPEEALRDREQFWAAACLSLWLVGALALSARLLIENCSSWLGLAVILLIQIITFFVFRRYVGLRRLGSLPVMIGLIFIGWIAFPWIVC